MSIVGFILILTGVVAWTGIVGFAGWWFGANEANEYDSYAIDEMLDAHALAKLNGKLTTDKMSADFRALARAMRGEGERDA